MGKLLYKVGFLVNTNIPCAYVQNEAGNIINIFTSQHIGVDVKLSYDIKNRLAKSVCKLANEDEIVETWTYDHKNLEITHVVSAKSGEKETKDRFNTFEEYIYCIERIIKSANESVIKTGDNEFQPCDN